MDQATAFVQGLIEQGLKIVEDKSPAWAKPLEEAVGKLAEAEAVKYVPQVADFLRQHIPFLKGFVAANSDTI